MSVQTLWQFMQALAKLERGDSQDLDDVTRLVRGGDVAAEELRRRLAQIEPGLLRYPVTRRSSVNPASARAAVLASYCATT